MHSILWSINTVKKPETTDIILERGLITFVTGIEEMRGHALSYLFLYNLAFVVLLLIIFALVYWGTTFLQLGGVFQQHLMSVKVRTSALLLALGAWLLLGVL